MEDKSDQTVKFVQLIENYQCLYNHTLAEHSRKDVTEKAWSAIGQKMKWTESTLVHYKEYLPLYVSSDASARGAGAVLAHKMPDDTLRPVAFTSRTFTDVETRYSTIDKKALAIVYAVTTFHQYLYRRHFYLLTDHKPLERIFSHKRETPKIASNRLLRWAMLLNSYNYALSRLPIYEDTPSKNEAIGLPKRGHLLHLRVKHLPMSRKELQKEVFKDHVLCKIIPYIKTYWLDKDILPNELIPYYEKRDELSYEEDMILWKGRICIPEKLRKTILKMLHEGHPGITGM
nr:uncharacterized protein LOC111416250 [Onthophagus taurus]